MQRQVLEIAQALSGTRDHCIAAFALEMIYHRVVTIKKKPISEYLSLPNRIIIDIHATRITKISTLPEANEQHAKKLKDQEEHKKAKWDEFINIGDELNDHLHIRIEIII